jgi:antitoxin (DNA-binding transcriptional repressor) of toxin-antitoxin stability system
MKRLSIREAREQLSGIERLMAENGEIVLTRRGKPIARILPLHGPARRIPSRAKLRKKMKPVGTPSEELIRSERDER